jgi:hypothetical protein
MSDEPDRSDHSGKTHSGKTHVEHSGTEPSSARSAYTLRRVIAVVALVGGLVGAFAFGAAAGRPDGTTTGEWVAAAICAGVALTALIDLLILCRRP